MSRFPIPEMIRVAELYYYRRKSQKEIGILLNISPATVSRMIQEALTIGLVQVQIRQSGGDHRQIEAELEGIYQLKQAVVVKNPEEDSDWQLKKLIGKKASELFFKIIEPRDFVGIGPGETMLEMISSLRYDNASNNIHLLPLMGGWGSSLLQRENNKLVITMASILQCDYSLVPAPAFVSAPEVKEIFLKEDQIKHVTELWEGLDVALFSVGPEIEYNIYSSITDVRNNVTEADRAVGDVVGKVIDENGEELDFPYNRKIISIPFSSLKQVPKRIGMGGGRHKYRSIRAALRARLINYLVTDYNTAINILESGESDEFDE